MTKIIFSFSILLIFLFQLTNFVYSQNPSYVGVNYTKEWTSNNNFRSGVGLLFERQMTNHSGFETGLYFRTYTLGWVSTLITETNNVSNAEDFNVSISEVYFSLPILYKYYSKIVNIAVGPNFDYFIGWNERSDNANLKITSYTINPKLNYGLLLKVSKPIQIADKLLLEPEMRYNPLFKNNRYYLGMGIVAKYKF